MPPPFPKENGPEMNATVIFTPGAHGEPGPTDVLALREELQRAFDQAKETQADADHESANGDGGAETRDFRPSGNGSHSDGGGGNGIRVHSAHGNGNGKHMMNGNGRPSERSDAMNTGGARVEAETIVDVRQIDVETARTRMRLAGLLEHPEIAQRAQKIDEALAQASGDDVDFGSEGVSYAVSVLGGVIAHRTAVNHVMGHLLASDSPERITEGDMVKILMVGKGGMGSVSAAYTAGRGLHMWKQLSSDGNGDAVARFIKEAKIMRALGGVGVPAFTHMSDTGYGYALKPRRSLAMLNDTFATMSEETAQYLGDSANSRSDDRVEFSDQQGEIGGLRNTYPRSFVNRLGVEIAKRFDHFIGHGVILGYLKPGIVLIADDGEVEIIDFGLGNADDQTRFTKSGEIFGTPSYMAPEQIAGAKNATPASDVWALGVMMYEMHAGSLPFPGSNPLQVMGAITNNVPDFSRIRNAEDRSIIMRMLNKNSDLRPSMREVAEHCFNATTDLKRKFGEDFSAYMKNPTSAHRLDMPAQKRSGLPDYVGASIASPGRFDFSGFDSLADGPLDSGIESERVLDTIRTKYRDDPAIDESRFPLPQSAPWYRRAGPLTAAAAAIALSTAAGIYSLGGLKKSAGNANSVATITPDLGTGSADAIPAAASVSTEKVVQPVAPDTRPGAKHSLSVVLDDKGTGALEWEGGRLEMVNGRGSRINFTSSAGGKQISIPFDSFHFSSGTPSDKKFYMGMTVAPEEQLREIARLTFGLPSSVSGSRFVTEVSSGDLIFVLVPEVGALVFDRSSGDVRSIAEGSLSQDHSLHQELWPLKDHVFDSVTDLSGNPYATDPMHNADRSTAIWKDFFDTGAIRQPVRIAKK